MGIHWLEKKQCEWGRLSRLAITKSFQAESDFFVAPLFALLLRHNETKQYCRIFKSVIKNSMSLFHFCNKFSSFHTSLFPNSTYKWHSKGEQWPCVKFAGIHVDNKTNNSFIHSFLLILLVNVIIWSTYSTLIVLTLLLIKITANGFTALSFR